MATVCPQLTKIAEGSIAVKVSLAKELIVSTYTRTVGTVVKVNCLDGFELEGPSQVRCLSTGQWDGNPKCTVPTTTPKPEDSDQKSVMDEPLVLIIVLAIVIVFVAAVIVAICLAIYWGRFRHSRDKKGHSDYYYEDSGSLPYSVSDRHKHGGANIHMYNIPPPVPAVDYDKKSEGNYSDHHHHIRSRDEQYVKRRHSIEALNAQGLRPGHHENLRRTFKDDYYTDYIKNDRDIDDVNPRFYRYTNHAYSMDDLSRDRRQHQEEISYIDRWRPRHDPYLWRNAYTTMSSWSIPRPYYDT